MKKIFLSLICLVLSVGLLGSCSPKEENNVTSDRTVVLDEIGLTYETPEAWKEFEETHIVPLSLTGEYTFAEVLYLYVTEEDLRKVNDGEETFQTVGEPIFEIAIAKTDTFSTDSHNAIFAYFNNNEIVGEQGDYTYYLFYDSKYAPKLLKGEDLENYNKLVSYIPEFKETIETRDFDASTIQSQIDIFNNYLTFDTETIEGAPVMSTIFADYDICMVNFGAAEGYSKTNEFEVLNSVNYLVSKMNHKKIGVIHVVIDSYMQDNLNSAITAKKAADADLITLKVDSYLETWVKRNLKTVPATVFVDTNGKIIGETVVGSKDYDGYLDLIEERIDLMEASE